MVAKTTPDGQPISNAGEISYVQFSGEDWSLSIRVAEGPYPPYYKVIPTETPFTLSLDSKVIDNIPMTILNPTTKQVMITGDGSSLNISGENSDEMKWESECGTTDFTGSVGFNADLLQRISTFTDKNPLNLKVEDASTACVYEDDDRLALIMPVRLPE